jgi:hypothetical protein
VPLPVPVLVVWIHPVAVVAVQTQPGKEVTEKLPEVAEDASVPLEVGLIE